MDEHNDLSPDAATDQEITAGSHGFSAQNADGDDLVLASLADTPPETPVASTAPQEKPEDATTPPVPPHRRRRWPLKRRRFLPLTLFALTCVSTFFVGATLWWPNYYFAASTQTGSLMPIRQAILGHAEEGLVYMGCLLAILLTHEMGHFVATLRYRIPASYPYFLPLPINPLGTMGAVIGMDGLRANRREMFDIGLAGPLAGLVVAIPIMWIGINRLDFTLPATGPFELDVPLGVRFFLDALQPNGYSPGQTIAHGHLNAFFMAGWVGLFVTGLNMMPVSQLDGGHVTYALFGKRAHWIARVFMLVTVIAMALNIVTRLLWLMVGIILLLGTDHPPTSDDTARLGFGRITLGALSLALPFLCFAPKFIILK